MEYLNNFRKAITQGKGENTYKMAWAKSIVELSLQVPDSTKGEINLPLEEISKCFIKYYFDHEIFFSLKQNQNPNKNPDFIQMAENLIKAYFKEVNSKAPVFFTKAENEIFSHPIREMYLKMVKRGITILKKDLSLRFLSIGSEKLDLYKYTKGEDKIIFKAEDLLSIKEESEVISDVIHFRWAQLLEGWNYSPKIALKVKVITPEGQEDMKKRKNLSWSHALLELYNPGKKCFLCPRKLDSTQTKIDVHHVLPFSFMYSDDLWNLVFTHKECNIAKSNAIPTKKEIDALKARNKELLKILQKRRDKGTQDLKKEKKVLTEIELATEHGYLDKFYNQIKL